MPGIIRRPSERREAGALRKPTTHDVLLRLEADDYERLMFLCRLGATNRNDILRQCLRYVHDRESKKARK